MRPSAPPMACASTGGNTPTTRAVSAHQPWATRPTEEQWPACGQGTDTLGWQSAAGLPGGGGPTLGHGALGSCREGSAPRSGCPGPGAQGWGPRGPASGLQRPAGVRHSAGVGMRPRARPGSLLWAGALGLSRGLSPQHAAFTCPADKVYQPCGPSKLSYCYGSDNASLMYAPVSLSWTYPRAPRVAFSYPGGHRDQASPLLSPQGSAGCWPHHRRLLLSRGHDAFQHEL